MEVPVYKLTINEDDINSGVDFVALVDSPAILRNFLAFSKHEKFIANEEKRVVTGPLMIPEIPIYRRDEGGEFYVVFGRDTIYQIAQKFMKELRNDKVNQMHQPDQKVQGVYMFESFIIDSKRGINTPKGFEHLPDGTWFGSYKIDNEEVWQQVKSGTFNGFSVEGFFDMNMERVTDDALLTKVIDVIKDGKVNKSNQVTLNSMTKENAFKLLTEAKKILFGEKDKFMDAVLKGADGNEINAVIDGELVPGTAINVDGAPVMDGDYEVSGTMVSCQGGLIVTVTPIAVEDKKDEVMTDEAKAEIMNQIAALEAKLSAFKEFDATELTTTFTTQVNDLKAENAKLVDSISKLFTVVETLTKEPAAKPVEEKKNAFKLQEEKKYEDMKILANTLKNLTPKK
jgi:hypothetical protein